MGKNNLLSGISESRNQIDNPQFSKRIVAFGILVSYCLMLVPAKEYLMERDNAAILSERYEIEKENLPMTVHELQINGNDLLALGFKGKEIKDVLSALHDSVIEGRTANENAALKEAANKLKKV